MTATPSVRTRTLTAVLLAAMASSIANGCAPNGEDGASQLTALDDNSVSTSEITQAHPIGTRFRTTGNVNYRRTASTSGAIIMVVPAGTDVFAAAGTGPTSGFYNVRYQGYNGWIRGSHLAVQRSSQIRWGVAPRASDALRSVGITADRIMQTIGNAAASAGSHDQDGVSEGFAYTAAVDLSVSGWSDAHIRDVLQNLGWAGYAAFYRNPCHDGWPCGEARHIHAVYAGVPMKSMLDSQISDYRNQRNGLASHTTYSFYTWSPGAKDTVARFWDTYN
jgi:hypothetical protein